MTSSLACVLDTVRLDQPAVDGSLLVGVAGARQVREEVRPAGNNLAVEPRIELIQDVLSRVQALRVRPRPQEPIPALAGLAPFRLPPVQPATFGSDILASWLLWLTSAAIILADIYLLGYREHMKIMEAV